MNVTVLKAILLAAMTVVAMVFGLAPIKVMSLLTTSPANSGVPVLSNRASLIISLISCFAGGVFMGVCFLDIMPDAMDAMEEIRASTGLSTDYPLVPLIFCLGFFFVYIFEEVSGMMCGHEDPEDEAMEDINGNERKRAATFHSIVNSDLAIVERGKAKENKVIKSITFVTAFLFHAGLEGFAFGVQDSIVSVTSLFFGIIVHKAVVCFSIGMRLVRQHPDQLWLVAVLIGTIALIAPVGGVIGILVEDSKMNNTTKNIVTTILLSLSLGTFIYITFFEILSPEHENKHSNLAQWTASFVGFALIAVLMIFG